MDKERMEVLFNNLLDDICVSYGWKESIRVLYRLGFLPSEMEELGFGTIEEILSELEEEED